MPQPYLTFCSGAAIGEAREYVLVVDDTVLENLGESGAVEGMCLLKYITESGLVRVDRAREELTAGA